MKVRLLAASELDVQLCTQWRSLQRSNPVLGSPFFCPEFTQAVAAVRPDVRVALMEDAGEVIGFFPHQQQRGQGLPVGAHFSDHHGVVAAPHTHMQTGTRFDWPTLLRGAGLAYWRFDHLAASQAPAAVRPLRQVTSPGMDISRGMAAYHQSRLATGGRSLDEYARKARRLTRALGPLRFELHTPDRSVFDALMRMKTAQYARTQVPNVMAEDWTRALLERLWQTSAADTGFGGALSALYAGDTLVAVHLGMRSATVWHWWFPAYDPVHSAFSPGAQILLRCADAAADAGLSTLDLGKGDEAFKRDFANTALPLVEGWVGRPTPATAALAIKESVLELSRHLRQSAVLRPLKPLAKKLRAALA